MANKYTFHPLPPKQELENLYYEKVMTQTEIAEHYNVTQKMVWSWFKKLNIKSRVAKKRNQTGENNDSWKGNEATYAALHYRVQNLRGKPEYCENCETTEARRFEWSNVNGNYADTDDYVRLCKSCHSAFDGAINNIRKGVYHEVL